MYGDTRETDGVQSDAMPVRPRVDSICDGAGYQQRIVELEREVAQLRRGLVARERIGVATGLVAERLRLSPENAFLVLRAASQNCNVKLREVARIVVEAHCGKVPEADSRLSEELHYLIFGQSWP